MPALSLLRTCAALAASAALLTACGGGNDDDPTPSEQTGVLTVTSATDTSRNGVYGDGNLNLTTVDKVNPIGSDPEVCTFKFDGANKVAGSTTAFGDIRYQPDATAVHQAFFTVAGKEFSASSWTDAAVVRGTDRIRVIGKTLTATDGSGETMVLSAIVPMRTGRPAGC